MSSAAAAAAAAAAIVVTVTGTAASSLGVALRHESSDLCVNVFALFCLGNARPTAKQIFRSVEHLVPASTVSDGLVLCRIIVFICIPAVAGAWSTSLVLG